MENQATMSDFDSILASRGVTRRSFMRRHRRRSRALPARGSARGASSGRVCYRRDVRQPVSGHLDRGCFLHRLHGVLRPGGDSRCRIGRARHDLPELLGDPVGRRWPLHGGGQGPDHRGRQLHSHLRGRRARGLRRQRSARGRRDRHHGPCGGCRVGQRRCGGRLLRRERRLDGRCPQPGPGPWRPAVPEEGRRRHAGRQRSGLPREPRVGHVRARGRRGHEGHGPVGEPSERVQHAGRSVQPDHP